MKKKMKKIVSRISGRYLMLVKCINKLVCSQNANIQIIHRTLFNELI